MFYSQKGNAEIKLCLDRNRKKTSVSNFSLPFISRKHKPSVSHPIF